MVTLSQAVTAINDAALEGRITREQQGEALRGINTALNLLGLSWASLDEEA